MNSITGLVYVTIVLTSTANALPSYQQKTHNPNPTWEFSLYQNTRCTGEATSFSGTHSTTCQNDILNSGALAYIPNRISDPKCHIHLFSDDSCAWNQTIRVVGAQSLPSCAPVPIVRGGQDIRSFYVRC